ncbi:UNVERIFIED_CONTAM: hypothetical protein Sindi_1915900 [Sesamum indicum]
MSTQKAVNPDDLEINPTGGAEPELRANEVGPCELNSADRVHDNLHRVRVSEANGFVVYTRYKRFKIRRSECVSITEPPEAVRSNDEVAVHGGNVGGGEGEMMELEMKEDGMAKNRWASGASGGRTKGKMEMEMSKEILVPGRPTTADELLQTGLMEGYSVFYDGGDRVTINNHHRH